MEIKFVEVRPTIDQEEVARVFAKYDIVLLLATDEESRLLGRILVDDVVEDGGRSRRGCVPDGRF